MKTITNRELRALDPVERVALLIDAIAREDDAERDRLWASCPRVLVDKPDIQTVALFERVRWVVAVVVVELTGPLARLELLRALRSPLDEDDDGLLDILRDRVARVYLSAHFETAGAGEADVDDEDPAACDACVAADDAVGFAQDVLDAFERRDANRIATLLHAFETWTTGIGLDAASLLAGLCPWIPEQLERHAARIDDADIDTDAVAKLAAELRCTQTC